jgi:hypothetical protein
VAGSLGHGPWQAYPRGWHGPCAREGGGALIQFGEGPAGLVRETWAFSRDDSPMLEQDVGGKVFTDGEVVVELPLFCRGQVAEGFGGVESETV